jgi:N-methylhydantoinase A
MTAVVSVDVGGTFTDVSVLADAGFTMNKVRTTRDPVHGVLAAIQEGLRAAQVDPSDVTRILHATTVATNAIFERKGARTAFVTTQGFGDVVHIGREVRSGAERFQITLPKPDPFVDEASVYEVPERVRADGTVLTALDEHAVRRLGHTISEGNYETLAVSLFHSYRNPAHEHRVREIVAESCPEVEVVLSSDICPEPGEYERAMTTIVCAYIAPLVSRYIDRLQAGLRRSGVDAPLVVIGSDGAGVEVAELRRRPIASLESGPVAGVMAARSLIDQLGVATCVTLDIGGTTSKAGVVVDGRIELTKDFRVGGPLNAASRRSASAIPVRMPVIDMAELGVGGGSIAWIDPAGLLRVGPASAGADPGPACFGTGGEAATVTDAAVVCGLLRGRPILGTDIPLDMAKAMASLTPIGGALDLDPVATAIAIRGVASAEIAAAVQRQLFYRGIDPSKLTLIAFGGTGPLHGAEVADIVGTSRVIVPRAAGVFTTFGLLSSEIGMERLENARIFITGDGDQVEATLARLELEARQLLASSAAVGERVRVERAADVRFRNQVQTLPLNLPGDRRSDLEVAALFGQEYERQFGLTSGDDVEIVQLRVRAIAAEVPQTRRRGERSLRVIGTKQVYFEPGEAADVDHLELVPGPGVAEVVGPAVVDFPHTSVTIPAGWRGQLLNDGDLSLQRTRL